MNAVTTLIPIEPQKPKSKRGVNAIEKVYREKGPLHPDFTEQLLDFIRFVLCRYSPDNSFPDDMVHFAYLRVMERLGIAKADVPKLSYDCMKNKKELDKWQEINKRCLFDTSKSNLGNYIFSITRNAHSNYVYHDSKKLDELEPPPTELGEPEIVYDNDGDFSYLGLEIENRTAIHDMPESLRRFVLWKQGV